MKELPSKTTSLAALFKFAAKVVLTSGTDGASGWLTVPSRLQLWLHARKYTLLPFARLHALEKIGIEVERKAVSGDIVQCGVFKGGSAAILATSTASAVPARTLWLFDSFEGLPTGGEKDGDYAIGRTGAAAGTIDNVNKIMRIANVPERRLSIVQGWFQDTFPTVQTGPIAVLHLDADLYDSTKLALERFYDLLSPGGYLVIDDYGSRWEGCKKAVDEFFASRGIENNLKAVDRDCYFQVKQ